MRPFRILLWAALLASCAPHQGMKVGAVPRTDIVTSVNGMTGAVTLPTTAGANWTVGSATRRYFWISSTRGSDANVGYTDTLGANPATTAKATVAGFAAIFPTVGAGRTYEVVVEVGTDVAGIDAAITASNGYANNSLLRATGTGATAGAIAFAGDLADVTYQGWQTATGSFAAGYSPTSAGTFAAGTPVTFQRVGGGAPAWATTEPDLPCLARLRGDAATTTVADRNKVFPIIAVPASNQLWFNAAITLTTSDVLYVEIPALTSTTSLTFGNAGSQGTVLQISGLNGMAITFRNGQFIVGGNRFSTLTADSAQVFWQTSVSAFPGGVQTQVIVGGTSTVGNMTHTGGRLSITSGSGVGVQLAVTNCYVYNVGADVVIGGGFVPRGGTGDPLSTQQSIGGAGAGRPTRFPAIGGAIRPLTATFAINNVSFPSGNVSWLFPNGVNKIIVLGTVTAAGSGATSGMNLGEAYDTKVYFYGAAVPTFSAAQGEIESRALINGVVSSAYSPYSTLATNKLGGYADQAGNEIVMISSTSFMARGRKLPPQVVMAKNTSGVDIPQYSVVKLGPASSGSSPTISAAIADSAPHATGTLGFLTSAAPNGGFGLVVFSGVNLPLIFDVAPTAGDVTYLSNVNAGQVKVVAPANARVLGDVVVQSDGTAVASFAPPPG